MQRSTDRRKDYQVKPTMLPSGRCPGCEKVVPYLRIERIEARLSSPSSVYNAVTYQCPSCSLILATSLDPISLAVDTAAAVADALKKQS